MSRNGMLLDSRINKNSSLKKLSYYNEIPRTRDLLKSAEFSINNSSNLLISNFFIAPSTMRYDDMVEESIFELNSTLTNNMKLPEADDFLNNSIEANIEKYGVSKTCDHSSVNYQKMRKAETSIVFHDFIMSEGHTGVLTKVSSSINNSTIDQLSRAILSEEAIFFYLACRAVIGFKILDADGISANIFESLDLVKAFINTQLVDKVIANENLNVSEDEKILLKNSIAEKHLSYFPGNPKSIILNLIDDLKSGGEHFVWVMNFLNSGKVNLDRNTNKVVLAQKMVDYLLKLGYNYKPDTDPNSSKDASEDNQNPQEQAAFESFGSESAKTKPDKSNKK